MNGNLARIAGTTAAVALGIAIHASNKAPEAVSQASIAGEWRCSAAIEGASFTSSANFKADGAMKTIDDVVMKDDGRVVKLKRSLTGKWQVRDRLLIIEGAKEEVILASVDGDTRYTTAFRDMRAQKPSPENGVRIIKTLDENELTYAGDAGVVTCRRAEA